MQRRMQNLNRKIKKYKSKYDFCRTILFEISQISAKLAHIILSVEAHDNKMMV